MTPAVTGFAAATLLLLSALCVVRPSTAQVAPNRMARHASRQEAVRRAPSPAALIPNRLRSRLSKRKKRSPSPRLFAAATDLLSACLDAGAIPAMALVVTGECLPGELGQQVLAAGEALADGVAIEQALPETGPLAPLGAVFRRSSQTGSAITDQLVAVAEQLRADDYAARLEHARRAGVMAALPLGGCMLPAFLLLAVVPAVVGLGTGLLL